jgi:hypothetical protein
MSDNLKHIDEFFKEQLKDISSETTKVSWIILYRRLFWKKWGLLFSITIVSILTLTGIFLINGSENSKENILRNDQIEETHDSDDSIKISDSGSLNFTNIPRERLNIYTDTNSIGQKLLTSKDSETHEELPTQEATPVNRTDLIFKSVEEFTLYENFAFTLTYMNSIPSKGFIMNDQLYRKTIPAEELSNVVHDSIPSKPPGTIINKNISLGIYMSPSYIDRTLQSVRPQNGYINLRNGSENEILGTGLGAEIKFTFNKVFFQTGIEYAIYGENAKYNFTTQNVDFENSYYDYDTTWVWVYDPPFYGEPHVSAIDSSWIPAFEKITMTSWVKNRYHYIEIPLLIGISADFKKFNLEAGTGISVGCLISCKGYLPDFETNSLIDLNASANFLEKISFNYILNAGIDYKLNEKWSIILKPNYKRNLTSVFDKTNGITQKYSTFGVITGIRIKF